MQSGPIVLPLKYKQAVELLNRFHIQSITSDSRKVQPDDFFVAIEGQRFHGGDYCSDALAKGAVGLICTQNIARPWQEQQVSTKGRSFKHVIVCDNPRQMLAYLASLIHPGQPSYQIAVTGTNGKTSVVHFLQQIWKQMGLNSASMGTVGEPFNKHSGNISHICMQGLTTPDPINLHQTLSELKQLDITHLALEASSHGIEQYRLDAMQLSGGVFTNFSQDHLDYHLTMEQYWLAKSALFSRLLDQNAFAVFANNTGQSNTLKQLCNERSIISWCWDDAVHVNESTKHGIVSATATREGFDIIIRLNGIEQYLKLNLFGQFQLENIMSALLSAHALGASAQDVLQASNVLRSVRGRMEPVVRLANGALVIVDYAHSPEALQTALQSIAPHFICDKQNQQHKARISVVFGCGGNRDQSKRAQMGLIADTHADSIYITDDNPRYEDGAQIRKEILKTCPRAIEIANRREAIHVAMNNLASNDVLLIAGKGHETVQYVGSKVLPSDDREIARNVAIAIN